jgi:RND family efflux transporter MFP subunit
MMRSSFLAIHCAVFNRLQIGSRKEVMRYWIGILSLALLGFSAVAYGQGGDKKAQGPPPVPVRVAAVIQEEVSDQITLIGTTKPVSRSLVAAEVSGQVEAFPVREGDFVKKGDLLVRLRSKNLELRLQSAKAARERVRANLTFAQRELNRYTKLKDADSIAERKYDEVYFEHHSLQQQLLQTTADIEVLEDDIQKKSVRAPFSGFVAKEHTQVGEWLPVGGTVVTLVDLGHIKISVDVPERYSVKILSGEAVRVVVGNISDEPFFGKVSAVLPEGDANARTFPAHVRLANPDFKIKSAMEARVTFNLGTTKKALLVPKDAIVRAGANRIVVVVDGEVAQPVTVDVLGYYDGNVAISGPVAPGVQVAIRGNERLMPGQPVQIVK